MTGGGPRLSAARGGSAGRGHAALHAELGERWAAADVSAGGVLHAGPRVSLGPLGGVQARLGKKGSGLGRAAGKEVVSELGRRPSLGHKPLLDLQLKLQSFFLFCDNFYYTFPWFLFV